MENKFTIFTDGSCNNLQSPHHGGWGFVILENEDIIHEGSGNDIHTTNNKMELTAIINSLIELPNFSTIKICTDSQYCITVLDHTSKRYGKNMELIEEFRDIIEDKNIIYSFQWVKGHSGNKWNEYVDNLANQEYLKIGGSQKALDKIAEYAKKKKNSSKKKQLVSDYEFEFLLKGDNPLREMIGLWIDNREEHYEILCENLEKLKKQLK